MVGRRILDITLEQTLSTQSRLIKARNPRCESPRNTCRCLALQADLEEGACFHRDLQVCSSIRLNHGSQVHQNGRECNSSSSSFRFRVHDLRTKLAFASATRVRLGPAKSELNPRSGNAVAIATSAHFGYHTLRVMAGLCWRAPPGGLPTIKAPGQQAFMLAVHSEWAEE